MDEAAALRARIDALEAASAHQERTIEELHAVIADQWKEIDRLKRQIARLTEELAEVEAGLPAPLNQKPPHY